MEKPTITKFVLIDRRMLYVTATLYCLKIGYNLVFLTNSIIFYFNRVEAARLSVLDTYIRPSQYTFNQLYWLIDCVSPSLKLSESKCRLKTSIFSAPINNYDSSDSTHTML